MDRNYAHAWPSNSAALTDFIKGIFNGTFFSK